MIGGGCGLLLAWKALEIGRVLINLPPLDITPDAKVLAYTLLLSAVASLMFGLLPALQSTTPDLAGAMKEEGSPLGKRVSKSRLRNRLIIVQVAVCSIFLIAAGLLVRGLLALNNVEPGFYVSNVFVTDLDLRRQNYDDARVAAFYRELLAQIDARPGTDSALSQCTPWGGICGDMVRLAGKPETDTPLAANFNDVSSNYFDVMGIRLLQGRTFTQAEAERGDSVAVVSAAMQKAYWHGESAIGKKFSSAAPGNLQSLEVIGVAADVRSAHPSSQDGPFFYRPIPANASPSVITTFGLGEPPPGTLEQIVSHLDSSVTPSVSTMQGRLARQTTPVRIGALLAGSLGGLVLILASVGIYGVMAYLVSQRTREIAIRMTLGAESSAVVRWMLRETMRPVLWGMGIGLPIAAALSLVSSKLLLGVHPLDPIAFVAVAAFLASVALLAGYLPARKAVRIDPASAMRCE